MGAAFTASEVAGVLGQPAPEAERTFDSVSTDTRTLQPGALFVALRGENGDGVEYLEDAVRAGAVGAVVPAGVELIVKLFRGDADYIFSYGIVRYLSVRTDNDPWCLLRA